MMRLIDHARIRVGGRVLRVHSDTVLCSGEGRTVRLDGVRAWKHFHCTYSAFLGEGIFDCEFRVHVVGRRKYRITNTGWASGAP